MKKLNENIEVAKITSRQAILVAAITAVAGLATGYFGRPSQNSGEANQTSTKISALETQIHSLENDLKKSNDAVTQARYDLANLKQRVRDILGPKEDAIRRMSRSLERMKGDPGVSQDHRERLSEIVEQLD